MLSQVNNCASAEPFALNVLAMTREATIAEDVARVCAERGHTFSQLEAVGAVGASLSRVLPNVLLLDWTGELEVGANVAQAVTAVHPDVRVVLAIPDPRRRGIGTIRIVDRWRSGERLVDELELAHIAIPPSVIQPTHEAVQPKG